MADQSNVTSSIGVQTVDNMMSAPPSNMLPTPPIHPASQMHFPMHTHYFPSQIAANDAFMSTSHGYIPSYDFASQLPTPPPGQHSLPNQQLQLQGQMQAQSQAQMMPVNAHAYHTAAPHGPIPMHPYMFSAHPQPILPYHFPQHQLGPQATHMMPHDPTGQFPPPGMKPRVTTTLWEDEGTLCFQVEAKGVCVARREDNDMVNGTKLLNVAGMTRGRRDGILKSEKQRHVVKVGAMHLKGVWIPYDRALDFANKEKIVDLLYPLFVADIKTFLYHPANYARTAQVMAAAERRKQESYPQAQVQVHNQSQAQSQAPIAQNQSQTVQTSDDITSQHAQVQNQGQSSPNSQQRLSAHGADQPTTHDSPLVKQENQFIKKAHTPTIPTQAQHQSSQVTANGFVLQPSQMLQYR
ncbi:hypothetical protein V1511DRAFT_460930 [Dipodascopsis uninucleata]